MASSKRPRDIGRERRVIYKISDSRRHLVGPPHLGHLATLYHPNYHPCPSTDPSPVHSHLPDLLHPDTAAENTQGRPGDVPGHDPPECAGFVAAGSWGASAQETTLGNHRLLEGDHPILNAIIEDGHPSHTSNSERQDSSWFDSSYSANPSVLDLIPELQRPQSYYYISSSARPGSSTSIGSYGWADGLDWSFPSLGKSEQWSGHLKSVLLDVFNPSSESNFPTILQPRFKKTPGTSAALFVPSVMASIWRRYSDETDTSPGVSGIPMRPFVTLNKEDYAAPVSSSRTGGAPLNKENTKTTSLSASVKRTPPAHGSVDHKRRGIRHGQNHDMAGGRLARWQHLLKYVLTSLKKQPSAVELQDMSSHLLSDASSSPTDDQRPPEPKESPLGEVIFFHYNLDGTDYTCTSEPIRVIAPRASRQLSDTGNTKGRITSTSSESLVIINCSESEEEEEDEEEETVIEAVFIRELDHDNCACTRFSNHSVKDGYAAEAESSSFVSRPLSSEFTDSVTPNGNVNGNCLKNEDASPQSAWKRRTSTIKRIPKIIKDKKRRVKFATNHKHRPRILGLHTHGDNHGEDQTYYSASDKQTGKHRHRKQTENHEEGVDDSPDEPFEWPENYVSVKVPPRWSTPRSDSEMETYVTVASKYVPAVYVKLYIQVPSLTHLCELKTHLLICIFRSFFTTTEGFHINWVMSLQSHVYNLLYMDVARVRFRRDSKGKPCRACLLLSRDATILVRHKRCCLLTTVTDILQIAPEELLVMEKGQRDRNEVEKVTQMTYERPIVNHAVR